MGARWAGKFHRVPSLSYLYGSMGEGPDAKPAKMAKAKAAKRTKGRRKGLSTRVSTRRKRSSVRCRGEEEEEEQGPNSIE